MFLRGQPHHKHRNVEPSKNPFALDITSPKFADDQAHLEAIRAAHGHGFPVLPIRYPR
jgi:hypothetical protein